MKNIVAAIVFLFSISLSAQILEPVKWSFDSEKISENEYELKFIATIDNQWAIYSQFVDEGGPIPTSFEFDKNEEFELIETVVEDKTNKVTKHDPVFDMVVSKFYDKAIFTQKIKLSKDASTVKGQLTFMTCDDARCLPPTDVPFEFVLGEVKASEGLQFDTNQILEPVKWDFKTNKVSDNEFDVVFVATMDEGWSIASQFSDENGPIPTYFEFEANEAIELIDKVKESDKNKISKKEPLFNNVLVTKFSNEAEFTQRVKFNSDSGTLKGSLMFQACDDEKCLFPTDVPFEFNYTKEKGLVIGDATTNTPNENESVSEDVDDSKSNEKPKRGLITLFFIAFLSGFAALLTPCVFPMIPLTVSFFTKQSKNKAQGIRNAIFYGVSIVVIYVLLGVAVSAIFGPAALNALASNVWFNIIFFLILIIFAVSFLGAFEITLPQSWANKVDAQSNRSGLVGIFFMALALAIVSFSCTGPIVGTILVEAAAGGDKIGPIIGMLGFSLAIALPFAIFAAFPGWLNSLPKSGGWLNTVKVVLGFLELALAFKFLSNADLVLQLHIFEREIFIAIWIAVFGTLAFYLFGKIQLPHDSPITHISVGRLSLGLLVLAFTIYLIPGLWGAPLKLISGFPPPLNYSESPYGVGYTKGGSENGHAQTLPDGAHYGVHDIVMFHDYETGLAYAKKVGKPVLLDFTGWSCVNCRKMEEYVWSEPKVLQAIKNDVVMISLYVDEKRAPKDSEQGISEYLYPGKPFKRIGDKWAEFQIVRYKSNAQPLYVLMDHNEENLLDTVAYTPDVDEYYNWIKEGVKNFKNK